MKNQYLIIIVLFSFMLASCSMLNKNDKGHSKEEIMKADAYAMANTTCEYQLLQLKYKENKADLKLKAELENKREEVTTLTSRFFDRYHEPKEVNQKFNNLIISLTPELSTCKKIIAIEEAKKNAVEAKQKQEGKKK